MNPFGFFLNYLKLAADPLASRALYKNSLNPSQGTNHKTIPGNVKIPYNVDLNWLNLFNFIYFLGFFYSQLLLQLPMLRYLQT